MTTLLTLAKPPHRWNMVFDIFLTPTVRQVTRRLTKTDNGCFDCPTQDRGGQPALDIPRQPAIKAARAKLTFLIPREGLIG
jgi:hypothetical protein